MRHPPSDQKSATLHRLAALALASALVAGCGGADDGVGDLDLDVPSRPQVGPIGANGMLPADFWAPPVQASLRALGQGALAPNGQLVATPLLDDAPGKSVLGYAIRCALPRGASVVDPDERVFRGSFGLAPDWAARGLVASEQRWVTACLLQHLNGLGAHVDVMLEGRHPALDARPGEDTSDFTVDDATMFGNVFVPARAQAFACIELDVQLACGLDVSLHTLQRLCGLTPTCGVRLLGLCPFVCASDEAGDPTCRVPLGPVYPESIRTKLRDTDLLPLYPGCDLL